jgi:TetR/AcrR family transcriptional repressor of nem operon
MRVRVRVRREANTSVKVRSSRTGGPPLPLDRHAKPRIHRRGFNGTSVDDITRSAKVPKGSFYNHFKGKEDLALEALDRYVSVQPTAILLQKDLPPLKRLKKYFTALSDEFIAGGCRQGCMLGNFSSELADHSARVRKDLGTRFAGWVELLAGFLLSAWEGTLLRARAANDPAIVKDFQTIAFNQLLT